MRWRVVPLETRGAFTNMGIDQALMEAVSSEDSPPTMRLYRWRPAAVSIGCFQAVEDEVDTEGCDRRGVNYVRRITGGGAVYHAGEVTYSVSAPVELLPEGITESYREICGWLVGALESIGMEASFEPVNDVLVDGLKISGSAQTRRDGAVLQHGTVIHELDADEMFRLLTPDQEKLDDKAISRIEDRVTSVRDESGASMEELTEALIAEMTAGKDWEFGSFTDGERVRAEELAKEKYGSEAWTFKR